jgi:hypothetical protein
MAVPVPLDVFGAVPLNFGGSFSADSAIFTFGTGGAVVDGGGTVSGAGVGLLTQSVSFSYQQQITRLFEVGTRSTYFISGRSSGSAQCQRVLGPRPIIVSFYTVFGNVCKAATNNLSVTIASGCNAPVSGNLVNTLNVGQSTTFYMLACVINSLSYSTTAESMIISESLSLMFVSLLLSQP